MAVEHHWPGWHGGDRLVAVRLGVWPPATAMLVCGGILSGSWLHRQALRRRVSYLLFSAWCCGWIVLMGGVAWAMARFRLPSGMPAEAVAVALGVPTLVLGVGMPLLYRLNLRRLDAETGSRPGRSERPAK